MILLLNTSTPTCYLYFAEASEITYEKTWESGRGLAKGLLLFIQQELEKQDLTWKDLSGLVVFKGPGSFTGLRIGITVMNSLAYANRLPIVGITGEQWQQEGLRRLAAGENDTIVMPEYGGEANITKPRK